jgi:hypothetical protein
MTILTAPTPVVTRIFDETDHLRECIGKKDHLWKPLPKRTRSEWRHAWQAARGTCRHCHRRQGGAAYTISGMWLGRLAVGGGGPCRLHHSRQAAEVAPAGWRHPGSQRALIFRQWLFGCCPTTSPALACADKIALIFRLLPDSISRPRMRW